MFVAYHGQRFQRQFTKDEAQLVNKGVEEGASSLTNEYNGKQMKYFQKHNCFKIEHVVLASCSTRLILFCQ